MKCALKFSSTYFVWVSRRITLQDNKLSLSTTKKPQHNLFSRCKFPKHRTSDYPKSGSDRLCHFHHSVTWKRFYPKPLYEASQIRVTHLQSICSSDTRFRTSVTKETPSLSAHSFLRCNLLTSLLTFYLLIFNYQDPKHVR